MGVIIPLALGIILGNDKTRVQFLGALQQFAGQGIDALNGLNKTGGVPNAEESEG